MKKLIIIFVMSILFLTACEPTGKSGDTINQTTSFRFVDLNVYYRIGRYSFRVYEDSKTKFLYLFNSSDSYGGNGLCIFLNTEGNPYTYDEFLKEQE